jgi:hypothetical protein
MKVARTKFVSRMQCSGMLRKVALVKLMFWRNVAPLASG